MWSVEPLIAHGILSRSGKMRGPCRGGGKRRGCSTNGAFARRGGGGISKEGNHWLFKLVVRKTSKPMQMSC
jgi:hypothetical protein